jgi:thiol-disulfide isomerase/thioredoxin
MKKLFLFFLTTSLFFFSVIPVFASEITLHFFWGSGCPHCSKEKLFLDKLEAKYPDLTVKNYEITNSQVNRDLLQIAGTRLNTEIRGVPFTVVGTDFFSGYYNDELTGKKIEESIVKAISGNYEDIFAPKVVDSNIPNDKTPNETPEALKIPLLGNLDINKLSLPLLTVAVAMIDGFNPCAMWTLLFLISLLLGMKDQKRMWLLGTTFIVVSAFAYFLFLSAWLNLFLFLGFVIWIRLIIGILALTSGSFYLKDYFINKDGGCKVMGDTKRQRIFEKLKDITQRKQLIVALAGIVLLAFAVNLVELVCSAGLPAIYTQLLSNYNLPPLQYYLYLLLYIFVFMLDDLFIFFTAMFTLRLTGIQSKYSRTSHLVGGILMIVIGFLLIFKPEWLLFG